MNTNIIKLVGKTVISISVDTVVGNAVGATIPKNAGKVGKILAVIGSAALGSYLGEKVANELMVTNKIK